MLLLCSFHKFLPILVFRNLNQNQCFSSTNIISEMVRNEVFQKLSEKECSNVLAEILMCILSLSSNHAIGPFPLCNKTDGTLGWTIHTLMLEKYIPIVPYPGHRLYRNMHRGQPVALETQINGQRRSLAMFQQRSCTFSLSPNYGKDNPFGVGEMYYISVPWVTVKQG